MRARPPAYTWELQLSVRSWQADRAGTWQEVGDLEGLRADMNLKSLLLCADDKIGRVLRRTLGDLDIGVDHCTSAETALRHLTRDRFEAIIVDCAGPGAADVLRAARPHHAISGPLQWRFWTRRADCDRHLRLARTLCCISRFRRSGRSRVFVRHGH